MRRRRLGRSGLEVSEVGLGGNTFGPPRLDEAAAVRVLHAALDMGVNFVDTAHVYGEGRSEEYIGTALADRRDRMVVATKFHLRDLGAESVRDRVRRQVDESLRRLRTEWIDLLQIHLPNPGVPADEVLGVMEDEVRTGRARAIGVSNYAAWRLAEAMETADARGLTAPATIQNHHNLLVRHAEAEVLPACRHYGVSLLPYHPLAGGFLTGKYEQGKPPPPGSRGAAGSPIVTATATEENHARLAALRDLALDSGHTVGELAVAWLLSHPEVGSVIAGVSTPDQLAANVRGAEWELNAEERENADRLGAPSGEIASPEYPGPRRRAAEAAATR